MDTYHSQIVGDVTVDLLPSLSIAEMAALYQEITGKVTERFHRKDWAINRTRQALEEAFDQVKFGPYQKLGVRAPLNIPFRGRILDVPQQRRGGSPSLVKDLFHLLSQSPPPTIGEALALVGGSPVRLKDLLHNLNNHRGYGIKEERGHLRLVSSVEAATAKPIQREVIIENVPSPQKGGSSDAEACARLPVFAHAARRLCRSRCIPHSPLVLAGRASEVRGSEDARGCEGGWSPSGELDGDCPGGTDGAAGRVHCGEGCPEQGSEGSSDAEDRRPSDHDRGPHGAGRSLDEFPLAEFLGIVREDLVPIRINVCRSVVDRIQFLMQHVRGALDEEDIIIRALKYYDRAVCASVIERSRLIAQHRDGSLEDMSPTE